MKSSIKAFSNWCLIMKKISWGFLQCLTKGLAFVKEEYRNLKIGKEIFFTTIRNAGHKNLSRNVVPQQVEYAKREVFLLVETRFTCIHHFTTKPVNPKILSNKLPEGVTIHPFSRDLLPPTLEFDHLLMGYERKLALELSCTEERSRTLVAMKGGECMGFGSIKLSCLGGGSVGLLYADDPSVAEVLLGRLIASMPDVNSFVMNTVSSNIPSQNMLWRLGCPQRQELMRMYTKEKIDVDTSKIFALMDLNFSAF